MKLELKNIKTIVICPDHNEKYHARKEKTLQLLQNYGFTNVIHFKSGTEEYPLCLTKANIQILQQNLTDEPLLIVEDDIDVIDNVPNEIEIDDTADAFYLGLSVHGGHPLFDENVHCGIDVMKIQEDLFRVYNMLSTHAVIYMSKKYKTAVLQCLTESLPLKIAMDVLISRLQKLFYVLCPAKPVFIQNDECEKETSKATQITLFNDSRGVMCKKVIFQFIKPSASGELTTG